MLRRRPVLRTAARTAVVAGTAGAVAGHVANKHRREDEAAAAAAPEPAYEAPSASDDAMDKIAKLAQLKDQGVLTEQEFAEQKAKLLQQI